MSESADTVGSLLVGAVLALYILAVLATAWYFRSVARDAADRFGASGDCSSGPVGATLFLGLVPPLALLAIPAISYDAPWTPWAVLPAVALATTVAASVALPLALGLQLRTPLEYFEWRYERRTRRLIAVLYAAVRVISLVGWIGWGAELITVGCGWPWPIALVACAIGGLTTAVVMLGGLRAVVWSDVLSGALLLGAVVLLGVTLVGSVSGGIDQVGSMARAFGRTSGDASFFAAPQISRWSARLPGLALGWLALTLADPIVLQKYRAASSLGSARRGLLLGAGAVVVVVPILSWSGLALLAVFHQQPQLLRPKWISNIDSVTRQSLSDPATRDRRRSSPLKNAPLLDTATADTELDPTSGRPLLDWRRDDVTLGQLDQLLAQHRLLHPNTKEPLTQRSEVLNDAGQIDPEKLAMRRPTLERELIVHERANRELVPWFAQRKMPAPVRGLIITALFASVISLVAAGLNAVSASVAIDGCAVHSEDSTTPNTSSNNATQWSRIVPLLMGVIVTLGAVIGSWFDGLCSLACDVGAAGAAPLLAVMVVALTTRRTAGLVPIVTLVAGLVSSTLGVVASRIALPLGPWVSDLGSIWLTSFGITTVIGYVLTLFGGAARSRQELRGLVLGCGPLGDRREKSAAVKFTKVERWR